MARLIVEEGGKARRFKLNPGTLTIGSGESATLTLESSELAEVHAELEFDGERAVLRTRPGVTPVTVHGRKVTGELKLRDGVAVKLGGVQITFESKAPEPGATSAAGATDARAGATRPAGRTRVAGSVPVRAGSGVSTRRAGQVEYQRRTITRSVIPTWAVVTLILGAAGLVLVILQKFAKSSAELGFSAGTSGLRLDHMRKESDLLGMSSLLSLRTSLEFRYDNLPGLEAVDLWDSDPNTNPDAEIVGGVNIRKHTSGYAPGTPPSAAPPCRPACSSR